MPDTEAAKRLLDLWESEGRGRKRFSRIWPLDSLVVDNGEDELRRIAATHRKENVVIPADILFITDQKFTPAIQKMLGRTLIAADDVVAAKIALQHRVTAVTLEGNIHKHGSLSGGWRGGHSSNPLSSFIAMKYELDQLQAKDAVLDAVRNCDLQVRSNPHSSIHILFLLQAIKELEAAEKTESLRALLQHQLKALQEEVWLVR